MSARLSTDRKTICLLRDRSAEACGQARLRMSVTRGSSPRATLRNDLLFTMSKNSPAHDLSIGPARRFHMDGSSRFRRSQRGDPAGGARRDRTDDLLLAKQALSQLSYGPHLRSFFGATAGKPPFGSLASQPKLRKQRRLVGLGRFELPTSRLSSARSNQLSYKPPVAALVRRHRRASGPSSSMEKEKRRRRCPAYGPHRS